MTHELKMKRFGFSDDPCGCSGIYFIILQDGKEIWESHWDDWETFYLHGGRKDMIDALTAIGTKLSLVFNTIDESPEDWKIT